MAVPPYLALASSDFNSRSSSWMFFKRPSRRRSTSPRRWAYCSASAADLPTFSNSPVVTLAVSVRNAAASCASAWSLAMRSGVRSAFSRVGRRGVADDVAIAAVLFELLVFVGGHRQEVAVARIDAPGFFAGPAVDVASARQMKVRGGQANRAVAVVELDERLHRAFAVRARAEQDRAAVVLEQHRRELRRRRRSAR